MAGVATLSVIAATVVIAVFVQSGDGEASVERAMTAASCTFRTLPEQGRKHVDSYEAEVKYNSFPPTSGLHHQVPVIWGAYPEPVPMVAEVHNLEHGGVIIHYGDQVTAATRARLRAFYEESPNAMLLSPLPGLGARFSFTAWTRLATCERFDEKSVGLFRSAYRGNGPERFRIGDLQPGT